MLRIYFKYDRKLLTRLCHCANEGLRMFLRTVLGLNEGILGMIMVIHTFRDYARFHPHLHAIAADGLFRPNGTFIACFEKLRVTSGSCLSTAVLFACLRVSTKDMSNCPKGT